MFLSKQNIIMGAIFIVKMFLLLYRLVKPGGVLVYSTCSIDRGENEERVAAFLLRHPVREIYTHQSHTALFHLFGSLLMYNGKVSKSIS